MLARSEDACIFFELRAGWVVDSWHEWLEPLEDTLPYMIFLEGKDLVLELADGASLLVAEALCGLLKAANHGRRTTEEDLDIVGRGRKPFLLEREVSG